MNQKLLVPGLSSPPKVFGEPLLTIIGDQANRCFEALLDGSGGFGGSGGYADLRAVK